MVTFILYIFYYNKKIYTSVILILQKWKDGVQGRSLKKNEIQCLEMKIRVSLMAQQVKNQPAMQETQETRVWFLGQEDPLGQKNGNALQCTLLKNSMDRGACVVLRSLCGPQSAWSQGVGHDWVTDARSYRSEYIIFGNIYRGSTLC